MAARVVTSKLSRDLVVHAPGYSASKCKCQERCDDAVDDVPERGVCAEEERVPDRFDKRRDEVDVVKYVRYPLTVLEAWQILEGVEDRREEEPGQEDRQHQVLDIAVDNGEIAEHDAKATRKRYEW